MVFPCAELVSLSEVTSRRDEAAATGELAQCIVSHVLSGSTDALATLRLAHWYSFIYIPVMVVLPKMSMFWGLRLKNLN